MTSARTRVGIVEWARRAEGARAAEMWLAESVRARLEDGYRAWRPEASAIAEARILRVLELIERDHDAFEAR